MKKMKPLSKAMLILALLGLVLSSLAACGKDADKDVADNTEEITEALEETTPEPTPAPTPAPTEPRTRGTRPVFEELVIISGDSLEYSKIGGVSLTTDNPAPGFESSWYSPASTGAEIFKAVFPAIDVTVNDYMTGAIKMIVWCSDEDLMGDSDNQFELSTTTNDQMENNWAWIDQIETGWNTVYLTWDDVRISDPEPDNTSLTWIRIYAVGREADLMLAQVSLVPWEQVPDELAWW